MRIFYSSFALLLRFIFHYLPLHQRIVDMQLHKQWTNQSLATPTTQYLSGYVKLSHAKVKQQQKQERKLQHKTSLYILAHNNLSNHNG